MKAIITNILCRIFYLHNQFNILLFSTFFRAYYYRISKNGRIIKYNYIHHLYDDDSVKRDYAITYECDKNYQMFNRIIHNNTPRIPTGSRMFFAYDTIFTKYKNIINLSPFPQLTIKYDAIYTKYVFVNIQLRIFDKEFTIYLRSSDYNFYFVGNKIDYSFICYYINNIMKTNIFSYFFRDMYQLLHVKNMLGIDINTPYPYTLNIIDHKFNTFTLNEWDSITLNKDEYIINKNDYIINKTT